MKPDREAKWLRWLVEQTLSYSYQDSLFSLSLWCRKSLMEGCNLRGEDLSYKTEGLGKW